MKWCKKTNPENPIILAEIMRKHVLSYRYNFIFNALRLKMFFKTDDTAKKLYQNAVNLIYRNTMKKILEYMTIAMSVL